MKCYVCKQDLPPSQFWKDRTKKSGLMNRCKRCDNKSPRKKRKEKRRMFNAKVYVTSIKTDGCTLCGYKEEMKKVHFHHMFGEKKYLLSKPKQFSKLRLTEEMKKCVIVCNKCHNKIHNGKVDPDDLITAYAVTQKRISNLSD